MSQAFSPEELACMRAAQEAIMMDRCVILPRTTGAVDTFNHPVEVFADGVTTPCGVRPVRPDEVLQTAEVARIDAIIRLPLGVAIDAAARVRVTHRHGVAIDPAETYELTGPPQRGPSGLVIECVRVTDGSDE